MKIPKQKIFKSKKTAEKYAVIEKRIATSFDVALNELYRQSNPRIRSFEEGQEITSKYVPFGYFKYKGKIWPVYDDDPGQCECIYLDGKWIGGGTYCAHPDSTAFFICMIKQKEMENEENRKLD